MVKTVFAGWLVAGLVWLEHAVRDSVSRVLLVSLVIFTTPATGLFHVVVSATGPFSLAFTGATPLLVGLREFVLPVLLGTTVGGVVLVTLLDYGQPRNRFPPGEGERRRLSPREWYSVEKRGAGSGG